MAERTQLPPSFKSTHDTSNLPGFPAKDIFGAAGEPVYAPVSGMLVYPHMIGWDTQKHVGGGTVYLQGDNGKTYFLTHFQEVPPSGRIEAGQLLGHIGQVPGNAWESHIHEGVHEGIYNPPGAPASTTTTTTATAQPATQTYDGPVSVADWIVALAPRYGLDPRAALAVAMQEGLSGKVGDAGTSFGPFQLHQKYGRYPSWAPQDPQAAQAWASSPAGIAYALQGMAQYAQGLTGNPAIDAIVRRFEIPAKELVAGEIAAAQRAYATMPASAATAATNLSYPGTGAAGAGGGPYTISGPAGAGAGGSNVVLVPQVSKLSFPDTGMSSRQFTRSLQQIMRTRPSRPVLPSEKVAPITAPMPNLTNIADYDPGVSNYQPLPHGSISYSDVLSRLRFQR